MKRTTSLKTEFRFVPAGSDFTYERSFKSNYSNSYDQLKNKKDEKFL